METITLIFMIIGLIVVFSIDTLQKRRAYLNKSKQE
jgi:hypothetical protein